MITVYHNVTFKRQILFFGWQVKEFDDWKQEIITRNYEMELTININSQGRTVTLYCKNYLWFQGNRSFVLEDNEKEYFDLSNTKQGQEIIEELSPYFTL